MKNNFSNFIKIIFIIILIALSFWGMFYLITKNDNLSNNSQPSSSKPDENIYLLDEELTTIFSYINNVKLSDNPACIALGNDLGYQINNNENFFNYYAAAIMDCLHEKNYPVLTYNDEISYKIISATEFNTYENYFKDLDDLSSIKDVYTADVLININEEEINSIQNYINSNYKIAYPILKNNVKNKISYNIRRIFKEGDYYIAIIDAIYNDVEYTGKLKIEIVNNYPQYSELIFY